MSSGNRSNRDSHGLISAVVVGISLLVVAVGIIFWGYSKQTEYYRDADENNSKYARNTYAPEANRCIILPLEAQFDCIAKASDEYRNYRRDENDLVAQKTSALWSYLMGSAAVIGMILSAFGIFLIWRTFSATKEANEIAKETGRDQSRAYVDIEKAELRLGSQAMSNPGILVYVRNSGSTPAKWFSIESAVSIRPVDLEASSISDLNLHDKFFLRWNAIAGPSQLTVPVSVKNEIEELRQAYLSPATHQIIVGGIIRYETIFDEIFETEFLFTRKGLPFYREGVVSSDEGRVSANRLREMPHTLQRPVCTIRSFKRISA